MLDGVDWAEKLEIEKADARTSITGKAQIEDIYKTQYVQDINPYAPIISTSNTTQVEVQISVNTDTHPNTGKRRRISKPSKPKFEVDKSIGHIKYNKVGMSFEWYDWINQDVFTEPSERRVIGLKKRKS